ncbi:MAG: hydrogenase iron-sulfur subunit [Anaerolineales bacterium]|nr:hydrogenase iron-sulfur subunit [Anaerolineales bacterium]
MNKVAAKQKIILFTCNWHAFSSLEAAGKNNLVYSPALVPIRISCLGRITSGIILKAFEGGAAGVCLIGCPEGECRYQNGNQEAREVFEESRTLLRLLGYNENLLQYHLVSAGDGESFQENIDQLVKNIQDNRKTR